MKSKYNSQIHHRRSVRLKDYDYSQDGYYYVTICTKNFVKYFGRIKNGKMELSKIGEIVERCWNKIPQHFDNVTLDEMVVMPDHVHGIIMIDGDNGQLHNASCRGLINQTPTTKWILQINPQMVLGKIIRSFKAMSCRLIRVNGLNEFQWQRNYYEHVIRNENELYIKRKYIINNPLKWHLDKNNRKFPVRYNINHACSNPRKTKYL